MLKYLPIILLFGFVGPVNAQQYKNPKAYFRKFQAESRKLDSKKFRYLEASLKDIEFRKLDRMRIQVLDQAKQSKAAIEKIGAYKEYDGLQKDYLIALQWYIDAFGDSFKKSDALLSGRYKSYDDLKRYYEAVNNAEKKVLNADTHIENAEEDFSKMFKMTIRKDEKIEEQRALLNEVTSYGRDMTLCYFRVDAEVRRYLKCVEGGSLDSLPSALSGMRKAVIKSKNELNKYDSFEGERDLYNETKAYLDEMSVELAENLGGLTKSLQKPFMEENEYERTRSLLNDFTERHEYRLASFFDTKMDLIEDYLPEK